MKWKNTDKECHFFNYNSYNWYKSRGRTGVCFDASNWLLNNAYLYPKMDLTVIESFKTTTIKPESRLYFDESSGFPRFKLSMSNNKRCIKVPKADYIVVSGNTDYKTDTNRNYIVFEDDYGVWIVEEGEYNLVFGNIATFQANLLNFNVFSNLKLVYQGRLYGFSKDSVYLVKYATGEYTVPFITDCDLDKVICNMCPDMTYEDILSIIDMLDSEDTAVVQLGMKALQAYNVEKYRLTLRLILMTRLNWYTFTRNTVGTKQLMETLDLGKYYIGDDFGYYSKYADDGKHTYTAEDVALAKQIGLKLLRKWLQTTFDNYFRNVNYQWLPDEKKVELI